jgi:hypothetical protein
MKDTKRLIKYYKGYILVQLHDHIVKSGTIMSIDELDVLLKSITGLDKSTTKMSTDELNELITDAFDLGDSVGIHLNYPNNEYKPVYDEEM